MHAHSSNAHRPAPVPNHAAPMPKANAARRKPTPNVIAVDLGAPDGVQIRRVPARDVARAAQLAQQFTVTTPLGYPPRLVCLRCKQFIAAQAPRDDLVAFVTKHEDCDGTREEETA